MSDMRYCSRAFLKEFIEIYRSHECLWKIKNKWYSDRKRKKAAYKKLVDKMREVDPEADRITVVKKINNLRSSYRKELKKVSDSKTSQADADNTYTPKLWYFNILSFLIDQETQHASTDDLDKFEDQEAEVDGDVDPLEISVNVSPSSVIPTTHPVSQKKKRHADVLRQRHKLHEVLDPMELPVNVPPSSETPTTHPVTQKRKHDADALRQRLMVKAEKYIDKEEDEYESFGKYVTAKLRKLSEKQRIIAEKQIMDALYNGAMNTLSSASPVPSLNNIYSDTDS